MRILGTPFCLDHFGKRQSEWGEAATCYLLTHAHTDHLRGLHNAWAQGVIVCHPITMALVRHRFPELPETCFRLLLPSSFGGEEQKKGGENASSHHQLHTPQSLLVPHPGTNALWSVTARDACHIPGSLMFILEWIPSPTSTHGECERHAHGDNTILRMWSTIPGSDEDREHCATLFPAKTKKRVRILCTGDFRLVKPYHFRVLPPASYFDHICIDTTWLRNPHHLLTRSQVVSYVLQCLHTEIQPPLQHSGNSSSNWSTGCPRCRRPYVLICALRNQIGKEDVVAEIAKALGAPRVYVSRQRWDVLRIIHAASIQYQLDPYIPMHLFAPETQIPVMGSTNTVDPDGFGMCPGSASSGFTYPQGHSLLRGASPLYIHIVEHIREAHSRTLALREQTNQSALCFRGIILTGLTQQMLRPAENARKQERLAGLPGSDYDLDFDPDLPLSHFKETCATSSFACGSHTYIPFSLHSSRSELIAFVRHIQPRGVEDTHYGSVLHGSETQGWQEPGSRVRKVESLHDALLDAFGPFLLHPGRNHTLLERWTNHARETVQIRLSLHHKHRPHTKVRKRSRANIFLLGTSHPSRPSWRWISASEEEEEARDDVRIGSEKETQCTHADPNTESNVQHPGMSSWSLESFLLL